MAQLSPFEYGQILAHMHHGLGGAAIARIIKKADGISNWSDHCILDAMEKLRADPNFKGERREGSGRPRETTAKQDKQIVKYVFQNRGREKVTVAMLKKHLTCLRKFGNTLVEERLHEAQLRWMRRRRKTLVPSKYIDERIAYCEAVRRKHDTTLAKWCYSDGTVFYLDNTIEENEHTQRRALGGYVWRKADCSDALYKECVGPSSYKKAQGEPVRVWGLLADGQLHIWVLPKGERMNRYNYEWLIRNRFSDWVGECQYVVQDFERCLRCAEPLQAMAEIGLELVAEYPRCSQDFNAIENVWKILRDRLFATLPQDLESSRRVSRSRSKLPKNNFRSSQ